MPGGFSAPTPTRLTQRALLCVSALGHLETVATGSPGAGWSTLPVVQRQHQSPRPPPLLSRGSWHRNHRRFNHLVPTLPRRNRPLSQAAEAKPRSRSEPNVLIPNASRRPSYHRALMVTHQGCPQTPGGRMGARGRRRGPIPAVCHRYSSPVSDAGRAQGRPWLHEGRRAAVAARRPQSTAPQ